MCVQIVLNGTAFALIPLFGGCHEHAAHVALIEPLQPVSFLVGSWRTGAGRTPALQETWVAPSSDALLGIGAEATDDRLLFFEFLRIGVKDSDVVYFASPVGRHPPTAFRLTSTDPALVFENLDHDFPKRITYQPSADGRRIDVAIEGVENGQPKRDTWTLVRR